jgi:ElaB/YqjD/DUF883 family membrane-anchored ribosome-binding protein
MSKDSSIQELKAELADLADTLESVLNQGRNKTKEETAKLQQHAQRLLKNTRSQLGDSGERIAKTTREVAERADTYLQDKPWHGVGVGAVIGLIAGILIARR